MKKRILAILGMLLVLATLGQAAWKINIFTGKLYWVPSAGVSLTAFSSSATGIVYTNTTGVFSLTAHYLIPPPYAAGYVWTSNGATSDPSWQIAAAGYSDTQARAAISSSATGLTYTSASGVFSLTAGYMIPGGGTAGQALISGVASAPSFADILSGVPTGLTYTGSTRALSFTSGYALYGTSNVQPVNAGGTGAATFALNGILYGNTTSAIGATAIGAAGQILTVGASPFVPVFTTATYPATASTAGKILAADGTNWVASDVLSAVPTGLTYTTATRALSLTSGYIIPGGGTQYQVLISNGASAPGFSTPTFSMTATAGNALIGDGTNWTSAAILSAVPTGLTYTSSTRALSLTAGYVIPSTTGFEASGAVSTHNGLSTAHGFTTAGKAIANITNPGAITFLRVNADNTATLLSAADQRTALGIDLGVNWILLTNNPTQNVTLVQGALNIISNANCAQSTVVTFLNSMAAHTRIVTMIDAAFAVTLTPYAGDQFMTVTSAANKTLTSDAVVGSSYGCIANVNAKGSFASMNGSWVSN